MCTKRQGGQGLLEYILLLIVATFLVLGAIYKFNTAFQAVLAQWFDPEEGYFACLIKEGVLPLQAGSICEEQKAHFDFNKGVQKITSAGSGGPVTSGGGSGFPPGSGPRKIGLEGSGKDKNAQRAQEGGGSLIIPAQFGKGPSRYPPETLKGKSGQQTIPYTGSNKVSTVAGPEAFTPQSLTRGYVPVTGPIAEQAKKGKSAEKIPLTSRELKTARELAAEKAKKKAAQEEQRNLDFMVIIKWVFFAAILFFFIFFVGSFLLGVTRGRSRR